MNKIAEQENSRTLAAVLNLSQEEAAELLDVTIVITSADDPISKRLSEFLEQLLARTVSQVLTQRIETTPHALEVVLGPVTPVTNGPYLWVGISEQEISISTVQRTSLLNSDIHPSFLLLSACYIAARCIKLTVGEPLRFPCSDPLIINFEQIAGSPSDWDNVIDIDTTYLAGVGAVGNGFLFALSLFKVTGTLYACGKKA